MYRKCFLLLMLICLTVSLVRAQDNAACTPASGQPLRIGAVFPAQTVLMSSAITPYQGVVAMVQAVNGCGGVDGRPLELVTVSANNRNSARDAVAKLSGDVPLIIGSGLPAVSEVLLDESRDGKFVYWEVTEPLDEPHQWSFSPLPTNAQLGAQTAAFVQSELSPVLQDKPLRLAIINQKRPAAQHIADALSNGLVSGPALTYAYENGLNQGTTVARQIREQKINTVVIIAFDRDTDLFWRTMRQADANVLAYIQVGGEPDRANLCQRIGNADGLITVSRTGAINDAYRHETIGSIYDQYVTAFKGANNTAPDGTADLAASGTYILLRDVLPLVTDDFTVTNLQRQITSLLPLSFHGLMGESFSVANESALNMGAVAIFQQRQENRFCSLLPSDISTCSTGLTPFPTWRERVSLPKFASCVD